MDLKMSIALLLYTSARWSRPSLTAYSFCPSPLHHPTRPSSTKVHAELTGSEKRKKFIGLAKAVDRGQYHTYNPRKSGRFEAKSGLPDAVVEGGKMFTVLGIESSCDDTGGKIFV